MEAGIVNGNEEGEAINAIRMIFPDMGFYKNKLGEIIIIGRNIEELKKILNILSLVEISTSDKYSIRFTIKIKGGE